MSLFDFPREMALNGMYKKLMALNKRSNFPLKKKVKKLPTENVN